MTISKEWIILKRKIWTIRNNIDPKVQEKFKNLCGKTWQYDVPDELFQKRTSRSNRVLLRWKVIKQNHMTLRWLETFYGGVCVEFVNDDFFDENNRSIDLFNHLISKIGADEMISAIVSFRNEDGDSGATIARVNYAKYMEQHGQDFIPIKRKTPDVPWKWSNDVREGNGYFSIKWGSQTSYESHKDLVEPKLFNPAIEYANEQVCLDIDLTMSYFALHCEDVKWIISWYDSLILELEKYLKSREYDDGNLYQYCISHDSLNNSERILVDPIQLKKMSIKNFATSGTEESSVVCHNTAANKYIFSFDESLQCVLSPANPKNFFWATHLSNMMQQNYNLDEYILEEERRYLKRRELKMSLDN